MNRSLLIASLFLALSVSNGSAAGYCAKTVKHYPPPTSYQDFDDGLFPVFLGSFRNESNGNYFSQESKAFSILISSSVNLSSHLKFQFGSVLRAHNGLLGIAAALRAPPSY